jgi:phosphatidylserine/phosphatidylglycerophosphate/cardiolipin synthase-like enzyme
VRVRLVLDRGMHDTYPRTADSLDRLPGIEVRTIDIRKLTGSGVQHSKFFIADGEQTFLGSQNFDWRALKHIHEMGVRIRDASIAADFGRVFESDWAAGVSVDTTGAGAEAPRALDPGVAAAPPERLPVALLRAPGDTARVWTSYSPRGFIPDSMRWDRDAIVRLLDGAPREIAVQLLTYGSGEGERRDDTLDRALRRAAGRGVSVKLLVSDWMAGRPAMKELESLAAVKNVEVKLSVIPEWSGGYIPFARVDHCKYAAVDGERLWVGTSNWEPGYFRGSRNLAVTIENRAIASQARATFETSWRSGDNVVVREGATYTPRVHGEKPPPGKTAYGQ